MLETFPSGPLPNGGENTDEILMEFGFSEDEIAAMKDGNIV